MIARPPDALRDIVARDLAPVRPLPPPLLRAAMLLPFAVLLLVAAPLTFDARVDLGRLGWTLGWGASSAQLLLGLALMAAALRDAIPGRRWSRLAIVSWVTLALAGVVTISVASWMSSPTLLRGAWWQIGGLCLLGSTAAALPAVVLGAVLAARAWPTRPARTGALVGLAAGLLSDAGWRLFCHFSEPAHVLTAHLGGILLAACLGALLLPRLRRRRV